MWGAKNIREIAPGITVLDVFSAPGISINTEPSARILKGILKSKCYRNIKVGGESSF